MVKYVLHTVHYLQAPARYFWRWSGNVEVVEWSGGQTICYRDDLVSLLRTMPDEGLPPFGSLLLIIAACREPVTMAKEYFLLRTAKELDDKEIRITLDKAVRFLHIIHALPEELRTGNARAHLLQEVFEPKKFLFQSITARDMLDELTSGRVNASIVYSEKPVEPHHFLQDILPLAEALVEFPTTEALVMQLQTGISQVPSPPDKKIAELPSTDILDELAGEPATAGLARLTRMLIAAFNIPMHSRGSGDQAWGGITDITNRGNYDKLLLSELAQDTDVLTARLVNNEALYFRREQPPDHPTLQRTILLDTTLKMWGTPRVFAMAAALAFAWHVRRESVVEAYTLGGKEYSAAAISTKAGVVAALRQLDHALHCGNALENIIQELFPESRNEFILITDQQLFSNAAFQSSYAKVKKEIAFVITLGRDGAIQFYSSSAGGLKQIARAKLDLEQLLFAPIVKKPKSFRVDKLQPDILENLKGLFLPSVGITPRDHTCFRIEGGGVLGITENNRLLYWGSRQKGAEVILDKIEEGQVYFGVLERHSVSILIRGGKGISQPEGDNRMHYQLFFEAGNYKRMTITPAPGISLGVVNNNGYFYIRESLGRMYSPSLKEIRNFINNGYSTLLRIEKLEIDQGGHLWINNHILTLGESKYFRLQHLLRNNHQDHLVAVLQKDHPFSQQYTRTTMQYWLWPDGSELLTDNRGFIHFLSANSELPVFSMLSVIGKPTAFFAENRDAAGAVYFINEKFASVISPQEFYNNYIAAFIRQIVRSCS